jgi:23S rRNA pseudouridine1911/1915/1917 synthase
MSPIKNPIILFEDSHLIVLSKPAGLLSQGEITGDSNLVQWLRHYLKRHYVGLIHRLDRNTSGAILVAKRSKAARRLTDALQEGEIVRNYLSVVYGQLEEEKKWTHYLSKNPQSNQVQVETEKNTRSKLASLSVLPLAFSYYQNNAFSLVEFKLETGRSHQIRIQASAEGFPLLGDLKYFSENKKNVTTHRQNLLFKRPALHSYQISFPHPMLNTRMHFEAPLPKDFQKVIQVLKLNNTHSQKFIKKVMPNV